MFMLMIFILTSVLKSNFIIFRSIEKLVEQFTSYGVDKPTLIRIEPSLESAFYSIKDSKINITKKEDLEDYNVGKVRRIAHSNEARTGVKKL